MLVINYTSDKFLKLTMEEKNCLGHSRNCFQIIVSIDMNKFDINISINEILRWGV